MPPAPVQHQAGTSLGSSALLGFFPIVPAAPDGPIWLVEKREGRATCPGAPTAGCRTQGCWTRPGASWRRVRVCGENSNGETESKAGTLPCTQGAQHFYGHTDPALSWPLPSSSLPPPPPRLFPPKLHRVKVQLRSKVFSVGKAAGLELPEAHEGQCPARRSLHCPSAWPRSPGQTQPCAAQWLCGDCFSISEPSDSIEAESDTHTLVSYLWRPAPLGDTLGTRQALQRDAQESLILEVAVTRTAVTLPQAQETSGLSPLSPLWR